MKPFYYCVSVSLLPQLLSCLSNRKLHWARVDTYNHALKDLSWTRTPVFEQAFNLKNVASPQCLSSYQLAPSNPEKPKGQCTGPVLEALAHCVESSWKLSFKEVNVCGFWELLAPDRTSKQQFFFLKCYYFFQVAANGSMINVYRPEHLQDLKCLKQLKQYTLSHH